MGPWLPTHSHTVILPHRPLFIRQVFFAVVSCMGIETKWVMIMTGFLHIFESAFKAWILSDTSMSSKLFSTFSLVIINHKGRLSQCTKANLLLKCYTLALEITKRFKHGSQKQQPLWFLEVQVSFKVSFVHLLLLNTKDKDHAKHRPVDHKIINLQFHTFYNYINFPWVFSSIGTVFQLLQYKLYSSYFISFRALDLWF